MEDIKIGRKKTAAMKTIACPNGTNTQLVNADPWRTAIIIGAANNEPFLLCMEGQDTTQTQGILINSFTGPIIIDIEDWGIAVTGKWFASAFTAAHTTQLSVTEVTLTHLEGP
jgi:hypothetical protein